jgi:hypothetical protein
VLETIVRSVSRLACRPNDFKHGEDVTSSAQCHPYTLEGMCAQVTSVRKNRFSLHRWVFSFVDVPFLAAGGGS